MIELVWIERSATSLSRSDAYRTDKVQKDRITTFVSGLQQEPAQQPVPRDRLRRRVNRGVRHLIIRTKMTMTDTLTTQRNNRASKFPFLLSLRWLIGLILIFESTYGGYNTVVNWELIRHLQATVPNFSVVLVLLLWSLRFATGVLLLFRSKLLLIITPLWLFGFVYYFLTFNPINDLPNEFFISLILISAITAFVLFLYKRHQLK